MKTRNDTNADFKDETANKLPVRAKIFSTKGREDIIIVEFEEEIL